MAAMVQQHLRAEIGRFGPLMREIRHLLGADTAVFLVLDADGSTLSVAASSGVDRSYRGATVVPIGRGFAGSIAQTGQPLVLDEVTSTNVLNPMLPRQGIRSLAGVPITAGGTVIGVLHVGSLAARRFTSHDTRVLQRAARQLGEIVLSQRNAEEHTAALVLQRSLLPLGCPPCPASTSRDGTCRPKATSAATGTTCSACRRGGSAS